jgi:hypothetical protein
LDFFAPFALARVNEPFTAKSAKRQNDLLSRNCLQTLPVQFEQVACVFLGLGGSGATLEAGARAGSAAVTRGHGDEFHKIERDIFVATCSGGSAGGFFHESVSVYVNLDSIIAKLRLLAFGSWLFA